jgi:hypothetical protein
MKLKNASITASLLLVFSTAAFATWYSTTYKYDVHYHFSDIAWGKRVKAVYVHTGALGEEHYLDTGRKSFTWRNVQHVPMSHVGDHFSADLSVTGETGGGAGAYHVINRAPVVQYWLYFEDGTSSITATYHVRVRKQGEPVGNETSAACEKTPYSGQPGPC